MNPIDDTATLSNPIGLGYETWVDLTVANSVLAGVVVLLAALWALYGLNRLWQHSLMEDAAGGIAAARALGFDLRPAGLRARLAAVGQVQGRAARVEWRGGMRGAHSVVIVGDTLTRVPLLRGPDPLQQALSAARAACA